MSALPEPTHRSRATTRTDSLSPFMSVKQVAEYLHLNEKKVYALVREQKIPATKITGKWLFPKELIDRWLLDSSHGGLLTDRLVITGSDDPLLYQLVLQLATSTQSRALVSYSPTGTRLGLELLSALRADVGCVHWGPRAESDVRHPALLRQYPASRNWALVRACYREQGLIVHPKVLQRHPSVDALLTGDLRWITRQGGAGSHRFLQEILAEHQVNEQHLRISDTALSERTAAARIAMGTADVAPGVRASATEFGLQFVGLGWEAFDFALPRGVYFRTLFQHLLDSLRSNAARTYGEQLGGYDLSVAGDIVWGLD